jgi:hypothetical protein
MPQVGGVVLPLDLTDAMSLLASSSTHELTVFGVALPLDLTDAISMLAELLYQWTRQMLQVGGVALSLHLTDATGR